MARKTKHQSEETAYLQKISAQPWPEHDLYQSLTVEEDQDRTNVHYEQPAEFFYRITGGEWNTYSCNLWPDDTTTDTQSQEAKLDVLAKQMQLKPGQRVLDVGCGWAGPLVYLSKTYGVEGVGLTLSPTQKQAADARIAAHGANVQVNLRHWEEYEDRAGFDAVYTDEVIVHFHHLGEFFKKVHGLLRPGGLMVNKEVHYTKREYLQLSRGEVFINEIYGFTGNYHTLHEELALVDEAGFELIWHHQIAQEEYRQTLSRWLSNQHANRDRLIELVGKDTYDRFRIYLKLVRAGFNTSVVTIDVMTARKV